MSMRIFQGLIKKEEKKKKILKSIYIYYIKKYIYITLYSTYILYIYVYIYKKYIHIIYIYMYVYKYEYMYILLWIIIYIYIPKGNSDCDSNLATVISYWWLEFCVYLISV